MLRGHVGGVPRQPGVERGPAAQRGQPAQPRRLRPKAVASVLGHAAHGMPVRAGRGGRAPGHQAHRRGLEREGVARAAVQQGGHLRRGPRDRLRPRHLPQQLHRVPVLQRRYGDPLGLQHERRPGRDDQQEHLRGGRDEAADLRGRGGVVDHHQRPAARREPPVQLFAPRLGGRHRARFDAHLPQQAQQDGGGFESVLPGGVADVDVELSVGVLRDPVGAPVQRHRAGADPGRPVQQRDPRPPRGGPGRLSPQLPEHALTVGEVARGGRQSGPGPQRHLGQAPREQRELIVPPRVLAQPRMHLTRQQLPPLRAARQRRLPPQGPPHERARRQEHLLADLSGGAVAHRREERGERTHRHDLKHASPSRGTWPGPWPDSIPRASARQSGTGRVSPHVQRRATGGAHGAPIYRAQTWPRSISTGNGAATLTTPVNTSPSR